MALLRRYGPFARFIQAAKAMKVEMSPDHAEARIVFNGYNHSDLNRAGLIEPDKVAHRCESIRINLWADGFDANAADKKELGIKAVADLIRPRVLFMLRCHYHMDPGFFDPEHYYHPIESKVSICSVGKTSIQVQQRDISAKTRKPLSTSTIIQIPADKETRKPVPLPNSFLTATEGRIRGTPVGKFFPEARPDDAYKVKTRFHWSDADYYYHINQASYIRLGVDAAAEAAHEGRLPGVGNDLTHYHITDCHGLYNREVNPATNVEVYSWTKADVPNVIFSQTLQDGLPVFHMTLTLQPC